MKFLEEALHAPLPTRKTLLEHVSRLEQRCAPKTVFSATQTHSTLIADETADEHVAAKWEQMQYYEDGEHRRQNASTSSAPTSSSSSSSTSLSSPSSTSSRLAALNLMKKQTWRRIKSQFSSKGSRYSYAEPSSASAVPSALDVGGAGVSMAPGGSSEAPAASSGLMGNVVSRIRSSRSLQNLDKATRDSYYNLRDATSSLRDKYQTALETRNAKPRSEYSELWNDDNDVYGPPGGYDDDDDDYVRGGRGRQRRLQMLGL